MISGEHGYYTLLLGETIILLPREHDSSTPPRTLRKYKILNKIVWQKMMLFKNGSKSHAPSRMESKRVML